MLPPAPPTNKNSFIRNDSLSTLKIKLDKETTLKCRSGGDRARKVTLANNTNTRSNREISMHVLKKILVRYKHEHK